MPAATSTWTIDELGALAESALSRGYAGPQNGQIRAIPDRRTIRYYTTLGLLDRPLEMRGRTALYGQRHLLQLVAIKRLQARGMSLAEVQAELAGATDGRLAELAGPLEPVMPDRPAAPVPREATEPQASHAAEPGSRTVAYSAGTPGPKTLPVRRAGRFWGEDPAPIAGRPVDGGHARRLTAMNLAPGVVLLLTGDLELTPEREAAILRAAGPLLSALEQTTGRDDTDGWFDDL